MSMPNQRCRSFPVALGGLLVHEDVLVLGLRGDDLQGIVDFLRSGILADLLLDGDGPDVLDRAAWN